MERAVIKRAMNAGGGMAEGGVLTIATANTALADETSGARGEFVLLTVSDTGTGMEPEVLRRAVEPFFTTKSVGRGSGLGLSMVYGFVKQSDGHIDIESVAGKGTVVRIYLPMITTAEGTGPAAPASLAPPSSSITPYTASSLPPPTFPL